jgi:DNA-binding MarR family transcriptional regulator
MAREKDFVDRMLADLERELPELDTSPLGTGARILRLGPTLRRSLDAALAPTGVRTAGFGVLAALIRAGEPYELMPSELARDTLLTSGAMTSRIDRLERAGLVERRRPVEGDRRTLLICLTPAGKRLVEAAYPVYCAELERLLHGLTRTDAAGLEKGLRKASVSLGDVGGS